MDGIFRTMIAVPELAARLGQVVLVDMRHQLSDPGWGAAQYGQGHLPGAVFIHLDRDLSAVPDVGNGRHPLPGRAGFAARARGWGIDGRRQVVIYDQDSGAFAARLWWMLNRWLGLDCAAVLDGGHAAWLAAGLPLESTPVTPAPAADTIALPAGDGGLVTMAALRAGLGQPELMLVDARGAARYRGETEPLDPVAGHIPGALNRPFTDNLGPDGRMKPPGELRREWLGLIGSHAPEQVVHHCGSGVTACHNLLAMEHAGLGGGRLYAGSWSEWCCHPGNPVVRGPARD